MAEIPAHGLGRAQLFERLEAYRARDLDWRDGRAFAYTYDPGEEAEAVAKEAYVRFLGENALDPTVFPSLLQLENEIVGMAARHLGGGPETVGSFTSGGTESILMAVLAARDAARRERPDITRPNMVLPETCHAAHYKAAHYFDLEIVQVPVDPATCRVSAAAMDAAITDQTILLAASAPSYAYGVIDPIEAIGAVAARRGIRFHVDACMGGFLLPYFKRLGRDVPPFDLSVPGVTSISMDFHKYAFAPKGASVVLHRDASLRADQWYACSNWAGYTVVNQTAQSTRGGGPLAGCWAVLQHLGDEGYLNISRIILDATARLAAGIAAIDGLTLAAPSDFCLFSFRCEGVDLFHVIDEMRLRDWYIQPQLGFGSCPAAIHLSVGPGNAAGVPAFLADLREAVAAAAELPDASLPSEIHEQLAAIDPRALDRDQFLRLLAMAGVDGVALPERMAGINHLLDAAPVALREAVLIAFLNELYRPPA